MSKGSRDENGCLKVQEMRSTARVKLTSYRHRMLCIFLWRIHQCSTADWNGKPFQSETNVPGCNATLWFCSILVMATLSNLGKLSGARSAFGIDSRNGATSCLITEELRLNSNHFISGTMSSVCSLLRAGNLTNSLDVHIVWLGLPMLHSLRQRTLTLTFSLNGSSCKQVDSS